MFVSEAVDGDGLYKVLYEIRTDNKIMLYNQKKT